MACPFFEPQQPLPAWDHPRTTLGRLFGGCCRAPGATPEALADTSVCNAGYARGRCPRFPQDHPVDAVRFSISYAAHPVTGDGSSGAELLYILEARHAPLDHGRMPLENISSPDALLTSLCEKFHKPPHSRSGLSPEGLFLRTLAPSVSEGVGVFTQTLTAQAKAFLSSWKFLASSPKEAAEQATSERAAG